MKHEKHQALARPSLGKFGRCEWAIVGTNCGAIQTLAADVIRHLSGSFRMAYADADHADAREREALPGMLAAGAAVEYTDKIGYHQLTTPTQPDAFRYREWLRDADGVLVNGNHFEANRQVVVIDPVKRASLQKRLAQLTFVQLFILSEGADDIFDFVKEAIPNWAEIPVLTWREREAAIHFFQDKMKESIAPVYGLVLAGGRSVRMGHDKGQIDWHGQPQRQYMADLMQPLCEKVYISCREDQVMEVQSEGPYPALPDSFLGLGPLGGILSAFRQAPDAAWLVVACDLPNLDRPVLDFLRANRDPSAVATTFRSPHDDMPEPLITIWEPKSYPALLSFLAQGYSCPRKVLLNTDTRILTPPQPEALANVNTPEELALFRGATHL